MSNSRKKNLFEVVPAPKVRRNMFDLSHEVKMSGKFGMLYPVLLMDVVPGDTVRNRMTVLMRAAPMLAPIMHRVDVTTHFFFVPNRLLTSHWESFITGGQDGTEEPVLPYITPKAIGVYASGVKTGQWTGKGGVWDHFGLPTFDELGSTVTSEERISALPFRAMAKVYNDYYRDPNLEEEIAYDMEKQGEIVGAEIDRLLYYDRYHVGFEKDYFTSALPFAQRGPQVLVPMDASVEYMDTSKFVREAGSALLTQGPLGYVISGDMESHDVGYGENASEGVGRIENIESIENTSVTINDLRRSFAIQRWLEMNARGGGRYVEQIDAHFGMRVPDYRLQRAEYLGGGKQALRISEVLSTAASEEVPVGDMKGHGISTGVTNGWTYRCQEHGWILGVMFVSFRTAYQQGIPRMFSRQDKFDFAWPELARLGEQEIKSKELFFLPTAADDEANNEVFGYIPRYAEYKFMNDRVAGDFRDTLRFWHLGRVFTERPALDQYFTTIYSSANEEESFDRIFAVQDGTDYLWFQLYHHLTAKRPLPYFGVPSGLG